MQESKQSYKLLSPNGNFHYVVASTIYEAIQKAVALDEFMFSNAAYFKINGTNKKVKVNLNTNYKLN
jgi:hypothetical protein